MRRNDREMNQEFAYYVIDKAPFATISMVRPDVSAYGIPISVVREDDHFYFHSAMEGEKLESILYQNEICISAVSRCRPVPDKFTLEYESAVVWGKAYLVSEKEVRSQGSSSRASVQQEIICCSNRIKMVQKPRKIKVFRGFTISKRADIV